MGQDRPGGWLSHRSHGLATWGITMEKIAARVPLRPGRRRRRLATPQVLSSVLSHLDAKDLCAAESVCTWWRALLLKYGANIWKHVVLEHVALGMEPCLVGWADKDANGADVYCCEQPGGEVACQVADTTEKVECAIIEDEETGEMTVDCSKIERA